MKHKGCTKSINDESWISSEKLLSVWIICRVLMALVRIFIINIWGQCESGISLFKPKGLHWGHIFEGCRMETNWDLNTLLMRAEWGPWFSFYFPLWSALAYVLLQKTLFLDCWPSRWAQVWVLRGSQHLALWWHHPNLWWHPSHLKQRQLPAKPASWNARLTELKTAKKMENNTIPNLSKRQPGWDRGTEVVRNWWKHLQGEDTWSQGP